MTQSQHKNVKFRSIQLSAGIDPDGGAIRYSISGPVFSVDRDTGVVRLRQELDREKQDTIEVIISITGKCVQLIGWRNHVIRLVFPQKYYITLYR